MTALMYGFEKRTIREEIGYEIIVTLQIICGVTIVLSLLGGFRSFIRLLNGVFPNVYSDAAAYLSKKEETLKNKIKNTV